MNENVLYDLTSPQKNIWLINQMYSGTSITNICGIMKMQEKLNFELFEKALNMAVESNDGTRIKLSIQGGEIKQYISDYCPFKVNTVKLEVSEFDNYMNNIISVNLTGIEKNLYQFEMFELDDGTSAAIALFSHVISDAWSMDLFTNQVANLYIKLKNNEEILLNNESSYVDYINAQIEYKSSEKYLKDKEFWDQYLSNFIDIASLNTNMIGKQRTKAIRKPYEMSYEDMEMIRHFCNQNKISIFTLMMSIFSIYLSRLSRLDTIVIGTPILNRSNFKEKNTSGMFVSTIPFKADINNDLSFSEFLQSVAKEQLSMFRHQRYPYEDLLNSLYEKNKEIKNIYDVLISYQNAKNNSKSCSLPYSCEWFFNGHIAESLNIHILDINDTGKLTIFYDYQENIFSETDIANLHNRLFHIMKQVIANPTLCLKNIQIVTDQEKHELLSVFNETSIKYDENKPIVEYFEDQALENPNHIALVFEDKQLTYKELSHKTNCLAQHLRENGVTRNSIVGIMVNRSLEMIVRNFSYLKIWSVHTFQ